MTKVTWIQCTCTSCLPPIGPTPTHLLLSKQSLLAIGRSCPPHSIWPKALERKLSSNRSRSSVSFCTSKDDSLFRSLRAALTYFLATYQEDFYQPPDYKILRYLLEHIDEFEFKHQCQHQIDQFRRNGRTDLKSHSSWSCLDRAFLFTLLFAVLQISTRSIMWITITIPNIINRTIVRRAINLNIFWRCPA